MRTDQLQHARQHRLSRKKFFREKTRLAARPRVIAFHSTQRLERLELRGEELESKTAWQMALRPGGLHDAWASAGEVG